MTLLDAPKFDAAGSRRRMLMIYGFAGGFVLLILAAWIAVGHPWDAPWTWWTYWSGERAVEKFLHKVEANDLPGAYAIWENDEHWQEHKGNFSYSYDRFAEAFGQASQENEYGTISSHEVVVAATLEGGDLVVGAMINGRKSKPLFLAYDHKTHQITFSPRELTIDR